MFWMKLAQGLFLIALNTLSKNTKRRMMKTKEEILRPLPAVFTDIIESSENIGRLEYRIRIGTLEALLDIRDILDEAYTEKVVSKLEVLTPDQYLAKKSKEAGQDEMVEPTTTDAPIDQDEM